MLWELRAAVSLASFWEIRGRREKARRVLAGSCPDSSGSFDTPDFREARTLLSRLVGS